MLLLVVAAAGSAEDSCRRVMCRRGALVGGAAAAGRRDEAVETIGRGETRLCTVSGGSGRIGAPSTVQMAERAADRGPHASLEELPTEGLGLSLCRQQRLFAGREGRFGLRELFLERANALCLQRVCRDVGCAEAREIVAAGGARGRLRAVEEGIGAGGWAAGGQRARKAVGDGVGGRAVESSSTASTHHRCGGHGELRQWVHNGVR